MTIKQRYATLTAPFFKKIRNSSLAVLVISCFIPGASMAQSVNLTKNVAYKSVAGTVSLTVERSVQPPKKEKEIVKPHSASLQYGLNTWRNGAAGTVEYQQSSNITYCPTCRDNCIGKLWRIPVLEMAHSTASKEEKKLKNNRRYQYSVEELFLIPWRHQFQILDFFFDTSVRRAPVRTPRTGTAIIFKGI